MTATTLLVLCALTVKSTVAQADAVNADTSSATVQSSIVDSHNAMRSEVVPPAGDMLQMTWSEVPHASAQKWAEPCEFKHSPPQARNTPEFGCGQNIYMTSPDVVPWKDAIQAWDDEKKDFNFRGSATGMGGHYTQIVWAKTYQVGCGYKYCATPKNGDPFHFYVCDYCPAGNLNTNLNTPYTQAVRGARKPVLTENCALPKPLKSETGWIDYALTDRSTADLS